MPLSTFFIGVAVAAVLSATAALLLRWSSIALWAGTGLLLGIESLVVAANIGRETWRSAAFPPALTPLAPIGLAACGMAIGAWLERGVAPRPSPRAEAWIGTSRSRKTQIGAVLAALPVAVAAFVSPGGTTWWGRANLAAAAATIAVAILLVSRLEAVVGPKGVRVGFGPWAWPAVRVPLASIVRARRVERLARLGGRGWRVRPGGKNYFAVRQGEGIELDLVDGRQLTISVDDAETGAGLLNRLIEDSAS